MAELWNGIKSHPNEIVTCHFRSCVHQLSAKVVCARTTRVRDSNLMESV